MIGCVEGWQWCDVTVGPNRGGPTLGIPLIAFAIGPYWDNYYRGRPWYGNRHYWYNRPVARAPEWHAPPNWHANGPVYNGNDNRGHYDNRGNRGNDRHDNTSSDRPQYGGHYSANSGPDPRPHINDQAHPNAQQ